MWSRFKYFIGIGLLAAIVLGGLIYTQFSNKSLTPIVYRIAIDETWYPLNLYGKEQYITAFSKEILRSIATEQHFFVELIRAGSANALAGLGNGEYEGVLSSSILLEENDGQYIASNPFYLLGPILVVSNSSTIKSLDDLKGKTIGIIKRAELPIHSLDQHPNVNFVIYDYKDRFKMIEDVNNDLISGMILDMMSAYEYIKNGIYRDQLKIASKPLNNEGLVLIAKNNPESKKLIEQFNEGLEAIQKNGTYTQLLLKWNLSNPEKL
jgi:polar amino acid transport system substrate-binding protein